METLYQQFNDVSLMLLSLACLLSTACQGMHLFTQAFWRRGGFFARAFAYELLLMLHLVFASMVLREACDHYVQVALWSKLFYVPAITAAWVNAVPVVCGAVLAVAARRPVMVLELGAMALWLPPVVTVLGPAWPYAAAVAAAFMVFRSLAVVVMDYQRTGELATRFSFADVVNTVSEGILCHDSAGRILIANNAMRALLDDLGHHGVLRDAREARRALLGGTVVPAGQAWVRTDAGAVWQLTFDEVKLGRQRCQRVMAADVTELVELNDELDAANAELASMEGALRESLAMVDATAELTALAHMRARVHDVIGQRLSILHRALEDSALSREHLVELREIVDSIMDDLVLREHVDPAADLSSVVDAFGLIGVEIALDGFLPPREDVADAFVRVVREAATNAVRHAHATRVHVELDYAACVGAAGAGEACLQGCWTLSVVDNGAPLKEGFVLGAGIPGMSKAIEEVGGALTVEREPQFTVRARVPKHLNGPVPGRSGTA